jgi:hypothetical protein
VNDPKNPCSRSLQRDACLPSSSSRSLCVPSFALPDRGHTLSRSGFQNCSSHLSRWPSASRHIGFTIDRAEHRKSRQ